MAQPLFFQPDPGIEDADMLGYGDLIFDDGSSQFINGDPDIAMQYPAQDISQPEIAAYTPQPMTGGGDPYGAQPGALASMDPVPIPGSEYLVDPTTGDILNGGGQQRAPGTTELYDGETGSLVGSSGEVGDGSEQLMSMGGQAPASPSQPVPIPGTPHSVIPATGEIIQGGAAGGSGYGTGGLQLASREGALPPDVAARQASERETANANQMLALTTQRSAEENIYRQAALQRQGQLDAEQQALRAQQQEQQAKLSRWRDEQKLTAEMDIKTDLVSAEGAIGALFSVLGAAVLGYVRSDAGLRMIDNTIDTNIKKQLSMRDSKLRVLADQIGSAEQAMAAGKAELYKIAADKAEVTEKLTKADVYAAQTPSIVANLRQQQVLNEQKAVQLSLGKPLEKAPVAPRGMSATQQATQVEQYAKAASGIGVQERAAQRALTEIANMTGIDAKFDPDTGKITNREEIKAGFISDKFEGVGWLDNILQTLGSGDSWISKVIRSADEATLSDKALKIRSALGELVEAKSIELNPGKAPTDADRQAARVALGFTSEEGVLAGLERIASGLPRQRAAAEAAYGPEAAATYQRRLGEQGAGQPSEQQERMRPPGGLDSAVRDATGQGPQSSNAQGFIRKEEGYRSEAYQDEAGNWTIGYGHTGPDVHEGLKITEQQARQLEAEDMREAETAVAEAVTVPLDAAQQQALTSLAYNIGVGAFADSTLVDLLNAGDYAAAAKEFDRWNKVTVDGQKRPSRVLTRRRDREEALFRGQG